MRVALARGRLKDLGPLLVIWGAAMLVLVQTNDLGSALLQFGIFLAMLYVATGDGTWGNPWASMQSVVEGGNGRLAAGDIVYSVGVGSTTGLAEKYGAARVFDVPLMEEGMTGGRRRACPSLIGISDARNLM